MELNEIAKPAQFIRNGIEKLPGLAQGQTIKIKLEGEELLNATVPQGKTWDAVIMVEIIET